MACLFRKFLILLAIPILIIACNSDKKEQQALFEEVMLVHDEVMPKMGNLRALSTELSSLAELFEQDTLLDDRTQKVKEMRELAENLMDANEGMMEWMRQFEQVEEGTPHGEVIKYLNEQREEIQKVRDDMINSEEQAEKYLLQFNN